MASASECAPEAGVRWSGPVAAVAASACPPDLPRPSSCDLRGARPGPARPARPCLAAIRRERSTAPGRVRGRAPGRRRRHAEPRPASPACRGRARFGRARARRVPLRCRPGRRDDALRRTRALGRRARRVHRGDHPMSAGPTAAARVLTLPIRGWQVLSRRMRPRCRFHPSCSSYAFEALERHGALRGSWLAVLRLGRCHPWNAGGLDPVPPPTNTRSLRRSSPSRPVETV